MKSLAITEIIPVFAQKVLQIGLLPEILSRQVKNHENRIRQYYSLERGAENQGIELKIDCVIFGLEFFQIKVLRSKLPEALEVLSPNGQISFISIGRPDQWIAWAQWDEYLSEMGLIRYHEGPVAGVSPVQNFWAVTAVGSRYNPVAHARQLAEAGRPEWAVAVLNAIPDALIPDENVRGRLDSEKKRYRDPARQTIYLGLVKGEGYGWGICSKYFIKELSRVRPVRVLDSSDDATQSAQLDGPVFQALTNVNFDAMFSGVRGTKNFGYTFFENELTEFSRKNARNYDMVLGGSTWCLERMREIGIDNSDILIQGIDAEIFYPIETAPDPERFVIFSGGKFELRKGQDLVLRAVKIMQDKYPDVWLVNCWYNLWPASTRLMCYSPHIRFEHRDHEKWTDTMARTYAANGLDARRIVTCELMPQDLQRDLYSRTDIGLFPNRCEGGTNLVLMEYMACAKPVVASNTSGHRDIVNQNNALLLDRLTPFDLTDAKGEHIARWQDPSLDEIVAQLEYAYHHRQETRQIGRRAGTDLKKFTWANSTHRLLQIMRNEERRS